jgi:N-acetylglucosamine-6-phosphate deacetylase
LQIDSRAAGMKEKFMSDQVQVPLAIRNAAVVLPDGLRRVDIGMRSGKIERIGDVLDGYPSEIDALGYTVIPGMIDVHTHGAMRVDVNSASAGDYDALSRFFASEGITGFVPTVVCDAENRMIEAVRRASDARRNVQGAAILGCHLEGPFLSAEFKGAMPRRFLQAGDAALISRFLDAARSCALCMTVSPEVGGVEALMHYLVSQGIRVGLGHSGATYEQTVNCLRAGASHFTHVMNAMRPLDRREPGILGAALESDALCEFICDGLHVHPANIRLLLKAKGIGKLIGISDSIMATGLGGGTYRLGTHRVTVKDGDCTLRDGRTRAGSTLTLQKALVNFMHFTGLPLDQAILPFSANPAKMLGIDKQKGRIAEGMDADLTVLDGRMNVQYTFVEQKTVYRRSASQP